MLVNLSRKVYYSNNFLTLDYNQFSHQEIRLKNDINLLIILSITFHFINFVSFVYPVNFFFNLMLC